MVLRACAALPQIGQDVAPRQLLALRNVYPKAVQTYLNCEYLKIIF